jgi:serine/threonine protein kinase
MWFRNTLFIILLAWVQPVFAMARSSQFLECIGKLKQLLRAKAASGEDRAISHEVSFGPYNPPVGFGQVLKVGDSLTGHDEIIEIKRGAMSDVIIVKDRFSPDEKIVIRVLRKNSLSSDEITSLARNLFANEGNLLEAWDHASIVKIFDHHVSQDDGTDYQIMEYINGPTLKDKMMNRPIGGEYNPEPLPESYVNEMLNYASQLLSVLEFLEEKNIVHRDISPSNILVDSEGRIVLADFTLMKNGHLFEKIPFPIGTRGYQAPELIHRGVADSRTDIYAFGAVMYQMLTGLVVYQPSNFGAEAIANHLSLSMVEQRLRHVELLKKNSTGHYFTKHLPEQWVEILLKMINPDPKRRFQSAKEIRVRLNALLQPVPNHAPVIQVEQREFVVP